MFDNLKKALKPISPDDEVDMNDTSIRNELTAQAKWERELKQRNLDRDIFYCFMKRKDIEEWRFVTLELIDEFQNLDNLIENIAIPCRIFLNESYSDVNNTAGAILSATSGSDINLTQTTRKRVDVHTDVYVAEKGVVFDKVFNSSQDLRITWEKITDCKIDSFYSDGDSYMIMELYVDDTTYQVEFKKYNPFNTITLAKTLVDYIKNHMSGVVDDGWA